MDSPQLTFKVAAKLTLNSELQNYATGSKKGSFSKFNDMDIWIHRSCCRAPPLRYGNYRMF